MQTPLLLSLTLAVAIALAGCTQESDRAPQAAQNKNTRPLAPHGVAQKGAPPEQYLADTIREQKLPDFGTTSIGTVFDRYEYFDSREWKETKNSVNKVYVDFRGLFKSKSLNIKVINKGISREGVEVKFVVEPDGAFYLAMVSKIEITLDGKMMRFPREDGKRILEQIYRNRELTF